MVQWYYLIVAFFAGSFITLFTCSICYNKQIDIVSNTDIDDPTEDFYH